MPDIAGTADNDRIDTSPRVADRVTLLAGDDLVIASTGGDAYDGGEGFDTVQIKSGTGGIAPLAADRTLVIAKAAVLDADVAYPDSLTFDHSGIEKIVFDIFEPDVFTRPGFLTTIRTGQDFAGSLDVNLRFVGARFDVLGSANADAFYLYRGDTVVDGGGGFDELIFEQSNNTRISEDSGAVKIESFADDTGFSNPPLYQSLISNVERLIISASRTIASQGYLYDASGASTSIEFVVRQGNTFVGGSAGDVFLIPTVGAAGAAEFTRITGGAGADEYRFQFLFGSVGIQTGLIITDFAPGDTLDFNFGAYSSARFIGTAAFTGLGIEVRYSNDRSGAVVLEFDYHDANFRGPDGKADATVTLTGNYSLEQVAGTTLLRIGSPDIVGTDGAEILQGVAGADVLRALGGADTLLGEGGDDVLYGGPGGDSLVGGPGNDTANYEDELGGVFVNLTLRQGYTNSAFGDTYSSIENVVGTSDNDFIIGDEQINLLDGGPGSDTLIGALGPDILKGGLGRDTASYEDNFGSVFVNLTLRRGFNNAAEGDSYENVENIVGGLFDDFIIGDAQDNRLDGALGADTLIGAGGRDTFVFGHAPGGASGFDHPNSSTNVETIIDFTSGVDTIELSASAFGGLAPGSLAAGAFAIGTAATDADARIIYDAATGALRFDADGSGSGEAVLFAMLDNRPALTTADFLVAG